MLCAAYVRLVVFSVSTGTDFASQLGLTQNTWSRLETGEAALTSAHMQKIYTLAADRDITFSAEIFLRPLMADELTALSAAILDTSLRCSRDALTDRITAARAALDVFTPAAA